MNYLYSSSRGLFLFVIVGYRIPGPSRPHLSCSSALSMYFFIYHPLSSDAQTGAEQLYWSVCHTCLFLPAHCQAQDYKHKAESYGLALRVRVKQHFGLGQIVKSYNR